MQKFKTEIKWGIIFSITSVLWMIVEKSLGWHSTKIDQHSYLTLLFAIPALILYFLALKEKNENEYQGKINWMQGAISGLIIGIVVALLSPIVQYITLHMISPDYFENAINNAVESKKMTSAAAAKFFNYRSYLWQAIVSAPIMGILSGAIVSLFLRRS